MLKRLAYFATVSCKNLLILNRGYTTHVIHPAHEFAKCLFLQVKIKTNQTCQIVMNKIKRKETYLVLEFVDICFQEVIKDREVLTLLQGKVPEVADKHEAFLIWCFIIGVIRVNTRFKHDTKFGQIILPQTLKKVIFVQIARMLV